jgi:predicted aspartyl protease
VQVEIAGSAPQPFIVDTGASVTLIDTALAEELALDPSAGFQVEVYGVSGVATAVAYPDLSVKLGEEVITPQWLAVLELPEMYASSRGVLGVDVLSQRVIELDGEELTLRLGRAPYNPPWGVDASRADLIVDPHGFPLVELEVNNARGLAFIDTGLPSMIIVPEFAARARVPTPDGPLTFVDVTSEITAVRRSGRARLSIGQSRWLVDQVALVRPPVLDLIEAPAEAILGAQVFADATLVLDFERRELYLVDQPRD